MRNINICQHCIHLRKHKNAKPTYCCTQMDKGEFHRKHLFGKLGLCLCAMKPEQEGTGITLRRKLKLCEKCPHLNRPTIFQDRKKFFSCTQAPCEKFAICERSVTKVPYEFREVPSGCTMTLEMMVLQQKEEMVR